MPGQRAHAVAKPGCNAIVRRCGIGWECGEAWIGLNILGAPAVLLTDLPLRFSPPFAHLAT